MMVNAERMSEILSQSNNSGNTPILGYLVQFWQTSGHGLGGRGGAGVRNVTVTGSSTSVTLTSLRPAAEYQVQVSTLFLISVLYPLDLKE